MPMETFYTASEQETRALAERLAERAQPGLVLCLAGELGAGKTVFAQAFCRALGVTEVVNSPTFTIVNEYRGSQFPIYHFDLYRIGDPSELCEIGFDDYVYGPGICLIEWAEHAGDQLPNNRQVLTIVRDDARGETCRRITLSQLE